MFFSLAWRNIWRSKSSTRITMILTIWATLILSTFISLLNGTFDKQYNDTVNLYPGYIHIKHPKYADDKNYDNLLYDVKSIYKKLASVEDIELATTRMESFFLFATDDNSAGAMLVGVEPTKEVKMSTFAKQIVEGRFLNKDDTNSVVLGSQLAKKLHLHIGDEVSIVGSAVDFSFAADILKVVGITYTGVYEYDSMFSMINKAYLDTILESENIASHIIVKPKNVDDSEELAEMLHEKLASKTIDVVDWHVHMKSIIETLLLIKVSRYMLIGIIFSVISIFALITLVARTHEIGLMRSLGTTPRQIIGVILLERIMLSLISITIGGVLAAALALYIEVHPFTFWFGTQFANTIGFMDLVFVTKFSLETIFIAAGFIFLFSLISILYPLWHLSRLKPLDAMRKS